MPNDSVLPAAGLDIESRRAGVCLHPTSLPGPRGIGELGVAARRFLDWMEAYRLSVWQFLPLGPTGYGDSPYQPLSVFAGNPLLIDLDELVEWGLLDRQEARLPAAATAAQIDYASVANAKMPMLTLAAKRFAEGRDRVLGTEFDAFREANDALWLDDFAAFIVQKALNRGLAWPQWAWARQGHGNQSAQVAHDHSAEWLQTKCIQFFFERQWAALRQEARHRGIVLMGDVPIYMALDCAEAWARPELLYLDADFTPLEIAGVPPDYFSADGQLWGNPVYRWDVHAGEGFAWWIARLHHALRTADIVRLDHFRGFDEYWSVPYGAENAREGRWNPGPRAALLDALAAAFGRVPCVAEDLGIITDSVAALRKAYAMPGMQVLQFLVDRFDFDADAIGEDCVCYTGTHDNDTTEGWFSGSNGRIGGGALGALQSAVLHNVEGASESVHKAMISLCFETKARIAIAPLQDYLGLDSSARLNTPGRPEGNWRWRVRDNDLDRNDLDYIGEQAAQSRRT